MSRLLLLWMALLLGLPVLAQTASREADTDHDGLSDYAEVHKYFTDPKEKDTKHDGRIDSDPEKRKEFTYTITSQMKLARPFDIAAMNDDYQDVRILKQTADSCLVEITYYPLNTNQQAIGENPNWRKEDAAMTAFLRPTPTENWDEKMRQDLIAALKQDGIDPDQLTDRQLVEKVSSWAMHRGKYNNAFSIWYVSFTDGRPGVYPPLRNAFDSQKPAKTWTDQEMFDHEVLGKQMFYNRTYGSCTSCSIYLTTILRALGIPTRVVFCVPPCDPNDKTQVDRLLAGIHNNQVRETVRKGIEMNGFCNHLYNEVYIDHHWVRLNYNNLGQNILDEHYMGLMTHVYTATDLSRVPFATTWGMRYARASDSPDAPEVLPRLSSSNPYMLLDVSDHFGKYAHIDNPEVKREELRAVTIDRLLLPDSPLIPDWVNKKDLAQSGTDFFISIKEWLPNGDYHQMRDFESRTDPHFVLRAEGHPDVPATLNGLKLSEGHGTFQVFGARIAPEDRPKLATGVDYTIVPANSKPVYHWTSLPTVTIRFDHSLSGTAVQ